MPTEALYIGLMSGTSMDGIDAVLVDLAGAAPSLRASHSHPYPDKLRTELAALTTPARMRSTGWASSTFASVAVLPKR
ncbi:hypothetical protein QQ73_14795 [Candidatus Endoriftia persephone str. Guaymas]|nr:hypothetical protein [Candidatus Endoriftia persephone str. Guaymas]